MPRIPDTVYELRIAAAVKAAGDPWQSRASCGRKVAHRDEAAATAEAVRLTRRGGAVVTPYRCRFCWRWHCGRLPPEGKR